jgi:hypothetical protein
VHDDQATQAAAKADWRTYRSTYRFGGSEMTAFEWGFFAGRDYGRAHPDGVQREHDCD